MNLKLTIFELTEAQDEAEEKYEIKPKLEDCDMVEMTFYSVDYVKPVGNFCIISSGGDLFTIAESAESVNNKINERKSFIFN